MKILEDQLLIRKFKAGDGLALRTIYEKYRCYLLKLAVVLTNDVDKAEDVVHDVFLSFAKSKDRIKPRGSLKNYLTTSVVNRIRTLKRNASRRNESPLIGNSDYVSQAVRPRQWAILSEQMKHLSGAMEQLTNEQREVLALRFEGKMRFRQIAEIQNVSANTVKGRYRYGIDKLRSLLNGKV
jgi:RNA polymerase sigma-70 factor (ECF subfamily)